jgi:formamidopyrimidine-DNA glycosylase
MPELPEVETIVNELNSSSIIHHTVTDIGLSWERTLIGTLAEAKEHLLGQTLHTVKRRGKYILLCFSKNTLVVHLRMTGRFYIADSHLPQQPYERARLVFDNNQSLFFQDTRKFGRWQLVANAIEHLKHLGIEPLSTQFTVEALAALTKQTRMAIKPFLLDQERIAGLGNIYVDEALWQAQIHPSTPTNTLAPNAIAALHAGIITVLNRGITYGGTSLGKGRGNYYNVSGKQGGHQQVLNVFRRHGQPCPRCGKTLTRMVLAQRSTHYCSHCQT